MGAFNHIVDGNLQLHPSHLTQTLEHEPIINGDINKSVFYNKSRVHSILFLEDNEFVVKYIQRVLQKPVFNEKINGIFVRTLSDVKIILGHIDVDFDMMFLDYNLTDGKLSEIIDDIDGRGFDFITTTDSVEGIDFLKKYGRKNISKSEIPEELNNFLNK